MKDYLSRVLKKTLAVALSAAMLCSTAAFAETVDFAGSSISGIVASAASSETIPEGYTAIYTIDDLYNIRSNTSGNYILMNDIDLSATAPGGDWDCGTGWSPIPNFSGILDGNGHKIANMNLYGNIQQAGFIDVNTGTIKNLCFDNVVVDVRNNIRYGTICSFINKGIISCCGVSGSIKITASDGNTPYVGGIAGYIRRGTTISCSYNSADISGGYFAGGICGCMFYESNAYNGDVIKDCYNTGCLSNARYMGGIVGYRYYYETVEQCFNLNNGAIFGIETNDRSITSGNTEYYMKSLYCLSGYTFGNPGSFYCRGDYYNDYILYSEDQFKNQANFSKLDFTLSGPWEMAPDGSHPQLKNIREITVTDIEITRMPPKTTYTVGDTLIAVGEISVVCSNGNTGTAAITADMLSGYDMNQVGKQNVTISYMGATADYEITVNPIKATSISLSEIQVSINKAQPIKTLTATVLPENTTDKTVTWSSSDTSVATVDENGIITAVSTGTTTVTAATENRLTATCDVTVYEIRKNEFVAEACTADGVKEYYYTFVNTPVKYYEDSNCMVEISDIENWKVIPAAGHSILTIQENRKEATCTEPGSYEEVKTCSVCGEEISRTTRTIRATGHTAGSAAQENRHEATCTHPGSYEEVKHCTVCGAEISRVTKTIPATGHNSNTVTENRKEATCTTPGSYDTVTYCTICGEELSRKTTKIPATGHDWGAWTTSGSRQVRVCNNDPNHKEYRDIEVTSVKVSKTSVTVNAGKTVTITATVNPSNATNKTVTWTTSNSSVATVSNGKITAKKAGTAKITAKTVNGKTATCTVTVKAVPTKVTLNNSTKNVNVGDSFTLKATVNPSNSVSDVTWSTSDSSVATVKNGKVTGKKAGTATITVKTVNGKTAKCKVTVKSVATKVKLNKTSVTLNKGKTQTLKATVSPSDAENKKVTWKSSNKKVATVDSKGKITAKGKGTATITASTSNGKKATCKVTVKVPATKITLNKTSASVTVSKTVTLKATMNPGDTTDSVTWKSSNTSVASVSSKGVVTGKKAGTATITATTTSGKKATCKVTVKSVPLSKAQTGFKKVAKYIETYGKTNSNGEKFIKETVYLDSVGDVDIGIVYNDYNSSLTIIMNNSQYKYPFTGNATLSIVQYYSSINESDANIVYYAEHYLYSSNDFGFNTKSTFSPSTASNKSYYSIDYVDSYGLGSDSAESTYNLSNTLIQFTLTAADLLLRDNGMSLNDLGYSNF